MVAIFFKYLSDVEFQKLCFRKLKSLEIEVVEVKKLLLNNQSTPNLDELPKLPVSTINEFNAINTWILDEIENRNKLVIIYFIFQISR